MAINVKNIQTSEVVKVSSLRVLNGKIAAYYDFPEPSQKWLAKFPFCVKADETITDEKHSVECRVFTLADGYELVKVKAEKAEKRQPKKEEPAAEAPAAEPVVMEEVVEAVEEIPAPAPEPAKPAARPDTDGLTDALGAAFMPIFKNVAAEIEANVRSKVQAEIDALKAQAKTHVQRIELVKPEGEKFEVEGLFCNEFEDICEDVNNGWYPYLWGAAGCGKSHTAEQVAKALGLDFYTQNMLSFAHEVAGYGNAAGEFVETPFFKAFSQGGLFFLDEADRSQVEGLVVLNQALAQGVFNFPVVGNVKAHPNFRFMAAGNTVMNGADEMYTSGQTQDASFKRRLVFYEMHYDRRIELPIMAQGDEELVNFVEDVRRAIKRTNTLHFVSYSETRYMKQHENKKEKALVRSTFKSLDADIIRQIYGELDNKENVWAKALYNVTRGRF